jgi:hypothetical protein
MVELVPVLVMIALMAGAALALRRFLLRPSGLDDKEVGKVRATKEG